MPKESGPFLLGECSTRTYAVRAYARLTTMLPKTDMGDGLFETFRDPDTALRNIDQEVKELVSKSFKDFLLNHRNRFTRKC